jgi:hypothetical protein
MMQNSKWLLKHQQCRIIVNEQSVTEGNRSTNVPTNGFDSGLLSQDAIVYCIPK